MFKNFVEQTSTTTGTGSYTMATTPAGRRAFAAAYSAGDSGIPYVATDDVGGIECGIGKWNAGVLERTKILDSSNAGAAVNWTAGTRRVYVDAHAAVLGFSGFRHNLNLDGANTAVPGNSEDAAAGYGTGSIYMATVGGVVRRFYCLTASVGAASWQEFAMIGSITTGLGTLPALFIGKSKLIDNALAINEPYNWPTNGVAAGSVDSSYPDGYYADAYAGQALSVKTTDATTTALGGANALYVDGYMLYEGLVTAFSLDRTNRRAWKVLIAAAADGSGAVTVDVATITDVHNTAGASGWTLAVVGGGSGSYGATINVTGAAATDIAWAAAFHAVAPGTP